MKILDVPQSGSVAGVTSSRNRFGQYRRTRAIPTNPNTEAQAVARSRLSTFAQAWRQLDQGERDSWETYAQAHPKVDSLGSTIYLTGLQWFIAVNSVNAQCGVVQADAAPSDPTWPVSGITGATLTEPADLEVAFTAPPATGEFYAVYATGPQSPGKAYFPAPKFIGNVTHGDSAPSKSFSSQYEAAFGSGGVAGQKVRVVWYHVITGLKGPAQVLDIAIDANI